MARPHTAYCDMPEAGPSTPQTVFRNGEILPFGVVNQSDYSIRSPSDDQLDLEEVEQPRIVVTAPSALDDNVTIGQISETAPKLTAYHNPDGLYLTQSFIPRPSFVSTVWGLLKKGATTTSSIFIPKSHGTKNGPNPTLGTVTTVHSRDPDSDGGGAAAPQRPALPPRPPIPQFVLATAEEPPRKAEGKRSFLGSAPAATETNTTEMTPKAEGDRQVSVTPNKARSSNEIRRSRARASIPSSPAHTPKTIDSPTTLLSHSVDKSPKDTSTAVDSSLTTDKSERRASLRKPISLRSLRGSLRALPTSLQMTAKKDKKPASKTDGLPKDPADMDEDVGDNLLDGIDPSCHSTPVNVPSPLPAVLQSIGNEFSSSVLGEFQNRETEADPGPLTIAQVMDLPTDSNPSSPSTFSFKVPFRRPTILDRPGLYPVLPEESEPNDGGTLRFAIDSPAPDQRFYLEDAPDAFGDVLTPSDYDQTEEQIGHDWENAARPPVFVDPTSAAEEYSRSVPYTPRRRAGLDIHTLKERLAQLESNVQVTHRKSAAPVREAHEGEASRRDSAASLSHVYVNHGLG